MYHSKTLKYRAPEFELDGGGSGVYLGVVRNHKTMPKKPDIPHKEIVDFILNGKSTRDAISRFNFKNENIANIRIWAAFKSLGIKRPIFKEERKCEFCGNIYIATRHDNRSCGKRECQISLISKWQNENPDNAKKALSKYRKTEKGRQNNLRMHTKRRKRIEGNTSEKWNWALDEVKKSLRKLNYLSIRNPWEYRIQHLQNISKMRREFNKRGNRDYNSASDSISKWQLTLRFLQTTIYQYNSRSDNTEWENKISFIQNSLRANNNIREWKKNQRR